MYPLLKQKIRTNLYLLDLFIKIDIYLQPLILTLDRRGTQEWTFNHRNLTYASKNKISKTRS